MGSIMRSQNIMGSDYGSHVSDTGIRDRNQEERTWE
jgi:hypothetical protein